ncbi:hypothetical protein [Paenibacillus sp. SI8]|uniref:hypothetical protein n=1 Tax=unclassified Paenibacillus TaxID=185978 RepID=UPI00346676BF
MIRNEETFAKIMDAIDLETFFVCRDESEAKSLMLSLFSQIGFAAADVVFIQHEGLGARVRGRAYIHEADLGVPPYFLANGGER